MPPRKRGGRTRGSATKTPTKVLPSAGAEGMTAYADGEVSLPVPALRPVMPMRRSSSRAGSEAPKQVRIKSPTPSRTPPFIGGIIGQASPERIRSSQSYEQLLDSPSPSAPTKPVSKQLNVDSPPSPSFSDLPVVGAWDYGSGVGSEATGSVSSFHDLSSGAEPPSPSLDDLPIVGEVYSDRHATSDLDATVSTVGECSHSSEPLRPSLLPLPTGGDWGSDADGGSEMSGDGNETHSDTGHPSPTLVDLPIVGQWESSDAGAQSAPLTDERLSDTDVPSPLLHDLPIVGEWDLDEGAALRGVVEDGLARAPGESPLKVPDIALSLQTSPFPTLPPDWGLYQQYLLRTAEKWVKQAEFSE